MNSSDFNLCKSLRHDLFCKLLEKPLQNKYVNMISYSTHIHLYNLNIHTCEKVTKVWKTLPFTEQTSNLRERVFKFCGLLTIS